MQDTFIAELYRCDLCRRPVDGEERERARRAWQPLIICERCVREADSPGRQPMLMGSTA